MNKKELKQKAKEKIVHIKSDVKTGLASIDWKEKRRRVKSFFQKTGKALRKQFLKLPKKVRRNIILAVVLAGSVGAVKVGMDIKKVVDDYKQKTEQQRQQKVFEDKLEQKYQITDKESFQKLYEDALPLIQVSMLPTECLILDPYSDNGKKVCNTIGLGSYWYPKDGNPKSPEWILAKNHFEEHGAHSIPAETALELADGWYRHREAGRVFKKMSEWLNGSELSVHEFAAIATVMYNSEKSGAELCMFVKDNYKDEMKCAQKIVSLHANSKRFKGLPKRHLHEAFLYLNYDNYTDKMYDFFVKTGKNSKGNFYAQTSVTQLSDEDTQKGIDAILSGDKDQIIATQNKISSYICKGGQTVREIINDNVLNETYRGPLLSFLSPEKREISLQEVVNVEGASFAEQKYKEALEAYNAGMKIEKEGQKEKAQEEFRKALKGFEDIIDGGHDGPDLHNDIAITYYHLGEYEKCIEESRKVLRMGDENLYPAANFNAAIAYEKMGNIDGAIRNYEAYGKNSGDSTKFVKKINSLRLIKNQANSLGSRE
ncbi:MAG: hypothetical protein IKS23_02355 [Alphaproteobacteria bacterium]|nr:hypothetical protein [Alphaproteobacteria bacterium]